MRATVAAHPSLALVKYWGKQTSGNNLPATPSIAVTLGGLVTTTSVEVQPAHGGDLSFQVLLNGELQPEERFQSFFEAVRTSLPGAGGLAFRVETNNQFPTSAGLASSASGFAALAGAVARAVLLARSGRDLDAEGRGTKGRGTKGRKAEDPTTSDSDPADGTVAGSVSGEPFGKTSRHQPFPPALTFGVDLETLSSLARIGSGSAARSVFGGFTELPAGAEAARQLHPESWWPSLRVVVIPVTVAGKSISSRDAMELTRRTSPFYADWVEDAPSLATEAKRAIQHRDLERLGDAARRSYLRMFATMFAADPPIVYWAPASLEIQHRLAALRNQGIHAWETMDAGPQVKVLTTAEDAARVVESAEDLAVVPPIVSEIGPGVRPVEDGTPIRPQEGRGE